MIEETYSKQNWQSWPFNSVQSGFYISTLATHSIGVGGISELRSFLQRWERGGGGAGDGRADLRQCGSFFKFSFPRLSVAAGNHSLSVLFRGLFPALLIPFCQRRFQGDSHPLARSGSCGCLPLLLSDTQLVGNLIKPALITYVKTQRGTSSAPSAAALIDWLLRRSC